MNVSVVGLGKIGSCLLACLANKGFDVIGVDLNKEIVDKINRKEAPFPESHLQEILDDNNIQATTNMMDIADTDMAFIRVATPSNPDGSFNSEYVETAVAEICRVIPNDKEYYAIVNTSTVMPGTMKEIIEPLVEQVSNRKIGKNIGLCYMPDFVALGSVIQDLLNPDVIIIGESDKKVGDVLSYVVGKLMASPTCKTKIHRMNFYNAETAKLATNNYLSMKISFTNTITEYCENIPDGDAQKVLDAVGDDSRIGKKFMKPGLGAGGFCFPRDQRAFVKSAIAKGIMPRLHHAVDKVNDCVDKRISVKLKRMMEKEKTNKIAILGITYKPDTPYTKESTVLKIIENLATDSEIDISVYDPSLTIKGTTTLNVNDEIGFYEIGFFEEVEECLKNAEIVFIGTPWKEFKNIDKKLFKNKTVIDSFGILKKLENESDMNYIRIGTDKFNVEISD